MSEDKKENFNAISKALNTEYDQDERTFDQKIQKFEETKNQLVTKVNEGLSLEDAEYMKFELKSLIAGGLRILEKLDEDIKIGTAVRAHEVYFSGVNSIRDSLKELRELNRTIVDIKLEEQKVKGKNGPDNVTINNFLDGKQLLREINKAKSESSLNGIKADFKIEEHNSKVKAVNYRNSEIKEQ